MSHIERLHPQAIAMGLDRVMSVKHSLALEPGWPIIIVGGTNGKGSCCAMLESILSSAGYRVGCYTSPHLLRYNERVRVCGVEADDEVLCAAFDRVELARGETSLTYFEFGTLAAILVFAEAKIDIAILEVGLGGRLDSVNAFDGDCALVASIDLDHMDYLGASRDAIAAEKAGIFRAGRPAICADAKPPATLIERARETNARLMLINRDFGCIADGVQWQYWGPGGKRYGLPHPALRGVHQLSNAAACITVLDCLHERLPVTSQDVRSGLLHADIPGRFQVLPGRPQVILDVAHNPHAARALAANLAGMPKSPRTIAVFSMLKDKDIAGVAGAMKNHVTHWHVASSEGPRAASAAQIASSLAEAGINTVVTPFESIASAWSAACELALENDRIVVFGSFITVAAVMRARW